MTENNHQLGAEDKGTNNHLNAYSLEALTTQLQTVITIGTQLQLE
jgi:hypothetical protein